MKASSKCAECGDPILRSEGVVRCAGGDEDHGCGRVAHSRCVNACKTCGWLCSQEEFDCYFECDSCGLLHNHDHLVSHNTGFVETFGNICIDCFGDDDGEALPPRTEAPKLDANVRPVEALRKREDQSAYLSHFIRQKKGMNELDCFNQLLNILENSVLEARPTGYYSTYNQIASKTRVSRAVCFTEGRLAALRDHSRDYSRFGIAFSKFHLLKDKGAAPAIYVRKDLLVETRSEIPDVLVPFINVISADGTNYQHEREWRIGSDFQFSFEEVRCVFAPIEFHEHLRERFGESLHLVCLDSVADL